MDNAVVSIRPAFLEVAQPSFQPSVQSSPANVYLQEVQAQTHDERRMSWTWRSPSSHLVASPLAHAVFRIRVTAATKLSRHEMVGAICGVFDSTVAAAGQTAVDVKEKFRPILTFGEGCCPQNAIESQSISVNGAVWTELNGNLYNRSLERCLVPVDIQQRAYSTCGGAPNRYDDTPLSGQVNQLPGDITLGAHGGAAMPLVAVSAADGDAVQIPRARIEGMTCDSGLRQRMNNFYDQIVSKPTAIGATGDAVTLEIRFPLQGGPFNALWGASGLSRSDPRLRMALGIANFNQGQVTLNFKDLLKTIVRRLGRPRSVAAASVAADNVSAFTNDITVEYDETYVPRLYLTYIRMPAFRNYPEKSVITVYRRDARKALTATFPKTFSSAFFDSTADLKGLQCASGLSARPSSLTIAPPNAQEVDVRDKHSYDVRWTSLQFPQVPNQLFIVFQKGSEVFNLKSPVDCGTQVLAAVPVGTYGTQYERPAVPTAFFDTHAHAAATLAVRPTHATRVGAGGAPQATATIRNKAEIAGRYIAQNQDSNAACMQLEITVQSAIGSWAFKSSDYPNLLDRDLLWQKHVTNCCDDYMKAGRGRWQDRASCVFLSCSDFLLGLSTSPGTVFPIVLDIKARFANRAAVCSGLAYAGPQAIGKQTFSDIIVGSPVVVACYNQQILSITSSSAVLSSQAFSQSTTASALASQG